MNTPQAAPMDSRGNVAPGHDLVGLPAGMSSSVSRTSSLLIRAGATGRVVAPTAVGSFSASAGPDIATDASGAPLDEVISVVHTKGGAGKSSLTTNLAYALSVVGFRVLVIDLDRQTGQSVGFGLRSMRLDAAGRVADVGAVLRRDVTLDEAVVRDIYPNLDLLPADERSLTAAELALDDSSVDHRLRLLDVLHAAERRWDVVLIDTPGRQTGIVSVALAASSGALVPAIPEGGPVAELTTVLTQVRAAAQLVGTPEIYGIVRMRIGGNSGYRRLAEEQTLAIAKTFGVPVLRNKIPEDARFGESHLAREPIGRYSSTARSGIAYKFLAQELAELRGWKVPALRTTKTAAPVAAEPVASLTVASAVSREATVNVASALHPSISAGELVHV